MKLYFLRHADALDGMDDAARPLSPKGKNQSRCIAKFFKNAQICFDVVYSSPLVRAKETAERVLAESEQKLAVQVTDMLRNETKIDKFEHWLKSLEEMEYVLLVGHSPSIGARVRKLLKIEVAGANVLELPTAGLAAIEVKDIHVRLMFFIEPEYLGVPTRFAS
jgi:phosphohistidine phosphatase